MMTSAAAYFLRQLQRLRRQAWLLLLVSSTATALSYTGVVLLPIYVFFLLWPPLPGLWFWEVSGVLALSLAVGLTLRQSPSVYRTAVTLDRTCHFQQRLETALHCLRQHDDVARLLLADAARCLQTVQAVQVWPWKPRLHRRGLTLALLMGLGSTSCFYGMQKTLPGLPLSSWWHSSGDKGANQPAPGQETQATTAAGPTQATRSATSTLAEAGSGSTPVLSSRSSSAATIELQFLESPPPPAPGAGQAAPQASADGPADRATSPAALARAGTTLQSSDDSAVASTPQGATRARMSDAPGEDGLTRSGAATTGTPEGSASPSSPPPSLEHERPPAPGAALSSRPLAREAKGRQTALPEDQQVSNGVRQDSPGGMLAGGEGTHAARSAAGMSAAGRAASVTRQTGTETMPQRSSQAYRQLWEAAEAALARESIPPGLRKYVRDYFVAIHP